MKKNTPAGVPMLDRDRAKALYDARRPIYDETLQSLYRKVRRLLESRGFSPSIKYRVKRFEAYYEKSRDLHARGRSGRTALISDMLGLRIVCPFLEDIETVKELIAENFDVTETDWKAAQHSFREFGYDSVHLLVKLDKNELRRSMPGTRKVCEVQLRTILQDAWAEVEHELVYKSDISIPNESIRRKLASLNATLTLSDLIFQEIRDYQKAIRQRGRKRQEKLNETLDILDIMAMSHQFGDQPLAARNVHKSSRASASQLEKTMLLALDAHSGHDLETAINLYGKLLSMSLTRDIRSLVYNHRGMAYFASGDLVKSINDFSKAISYNPENSRCYANRGRCYRITGKYEKALSDFDTAISIDPLYAETYFSRAQAYNEMELYCKALNDCEKTLEINPDYQPARDLAKILRERLA
jgi:putative GTP pyrophosphokinase